MTSQRRFVLSLFAFAAVFVVGTAGYVVLSHVSAADAAYMTLITLSTVGYSEPFELGPSGRLWTGVVIVFGVAVVSLAFTSLVTGSVAEELRIVLGRRKVQGKIRQLSGHVVLCGFGRVGGLATRKMREQGAEVVVVEKERTRQAELDAAGLLYVIGNAEEEEVLRQAGLMRASSLVAALPTDADNVYATLTARGMRPDLHIVSRAEQASTDAKLRRAGADRVVCPQVIGATRIADILTRPHVVDFFELAARGVDLELAAYRVEQGSPFCGKRLRDSGLRQQTGAMAVVITRADGSSVFQPEPDEIIRQGDLLYLIGPAGTAGRLDQLDQG